MGKAALVRRTQRKLVGTKISVGQAAGSTEEVGEAEKPGGLSNFGGFDGGSPDAMRMATAGPDKSGRMWAAASDMGSAVMPGGADWAQGCMLYAGAAAMDILARPLAAAATSDGSGCCGGAGRCGGSGRLGW